MTWASLASRTWKSCLAIVIFSAAPPNGWLTPPMSTAGDAPPAASAPGEEGLSIDIVKKGLGKEVTIRKGAREWYMLIEVTPENTVVVRQEKEHETYVVDESETHDRSLTTGEVDSAIEDFVNSVKTQVKKRK